MCGTVSVCMCLSVCLFARVCVNKIIIYVAVVGIMLYLFLRSIDHIRNCSMMSITAQKQCNVDRYHRRL